MYNIVIYLPIQIYSILVAMNVSVRTIDTSSVRTVSLLLFESAREAETKNKPTFFQGFASKVGRCSIH